MSQVILTQQGAFTADQETAINAMFTELYAKAGGLQASSQAFIKTDSGTKTLLAVTGTDRTVTIVVNVTTAFADGDGAQPTVSIGQTASTSKFAATSAFTSKAAGTTLTFGGTLSANTALIATLVAGTGSTETGAYTITATAVAN